MVILVVGASGATGRLLVQRLLINGESVKVIIRTNGNLSDAILKHENLTLIRADLLELGEDEVAQIVEGCSAIASCLGHSLNFKGIYGQPRKLVTDSVRRLCEAIRKSRPERPVKFVLMNTSGNSNRDIPERVSFSQACVIWLLRLLLPPHVDNAKAADYLRTEIGQDEPQIEWVVVRPDTLTNEDKMTNYSTYLSPVRSAIFDAGSTSRINVGHFIAKLITDQNAWNEWRGKMPVIYNLQIR